MSHASVLTRLGGLELLRGQLESAAADFAAAVALDADSWKPPTAWGSRSTTRTSPSPPSASSAAP
jgi:hypothetical protein